MANLPNTQFDLTEDQRSMVTLCIRIAAERFKADIEALKEPPVKPAYRGLIEQFERQITEAEALANRIDYADTITFGAVVPDDEGDAAAEALLAEMTNDTDDDEPTKPEEDDITTTDHVKFYASGHLAFSYDEEDQTLTTLKGADIHLADDADYHDALKAYMDHEQYWPNCWFISDHGNAHRIEFKPDDEDELCTCLGRAHANGGNHEQGCPLREETRGSR